MPGIPALEDKPRPARLFVEQPVRCRKCDHLFKSFVYRVVSTPREDTVMVDGDGDVIYDLVKVCPNCKSVYHWHTNDKTLVAHSEAFDRLMRRYPHASAIINADKSTG